MLTPAQVVSEVLSICRRPDKVGAAWLALNKALQKLSTSTELARDLVEGVVALEIPGNYAHTLQLDLFPGFRKFGYILPVGYKKTLELIVPDNIFDTSCRQLLDCYYVAGNTVQISLSRPQPALKYGYYKLPPTVRIPVPPPYTPPVLDPDTGEPIPPAPSLPEYWLFELAPYILVDEVLAAVFRGMGDETSSQFHAAEARIAWESLSQDVKHGGLS